MRVVGRLVGLLVVVMSVLELLGDLVAYSADDSHAYHSTSLEGTRLVLVVCSVSLSNSTLQLQQRGWIGYSVSAHMSDAYTGFSIKIVQKDTRNE